MAARNTAVNPLGERHILNGDGSRVIAASRRADGSMRKEIVIRPGFVREEDKERFVCSKAQEHRRQQQQLMQQTVPVGMCETTSSLSAADGLATHRKTGKRKTKAEESPPRKAASSTREIVEYTVAVFDDASPLGLPTNETPTKDLSELSQQQVEKKLAAVQKKLSDISRLEKKQKLNPMQTAKLKRRGEFEEEATKLSTRLAELQLEP